MPTGSPEALQTETVTFPDEQAPLNTDYTYGPVDKRLQQISIDGLNINYTYQPGSSQVATVIAGNVKTTYSTDGSDNARLAGIEVQNNTTHNDVFNESISGYNELDQRTSESVSRVNVANNGTTSTESINLGYTYDPSHADVLSIVTNTTTSATLNSYAYDGVGNRTDLSYGAPESHPAGGGVPLVINGYTNLVYNGDGDVTDDGTLQYGWDGNQHLTSVTPHNPGSGSEQEQIGYDDQGRMIYRDIDVFNGTTSEWMPERSEHYVWDDKNMVAVLDGNDQLLQRFTYGPTGLIAETDYPADPNNPDPFATTPTTYIVVADASKNVAEPVDATSGTVLDLIVA